jgi:hypothetical protein
MENSKSLNIAISVLIFWRVEYLKMLDFNNVLFSRLNRSVDLNCPQIVSHPSGKLLVWIKFKTITHFQNAFIQLYTREWDGTIINLETWYQQFPSRPHDKTIYTLFFAG